MTIAGIIAEYNPLHQGHAFHIQATREQTGCDYVIGVMAGAFTQRGEPAIIDKFARAEMALAAGMDAVFELPTLFAVRPAEHFARGGVSVLSGLGIDVLSFGCEATALPVLASLAALKADEPPAFRARLAARLAAGEAFPRAWCAAASDQLQVPEAILRQPNLTLGAAYQDAIRTLGASLPTVAIERTSSYDGPHSASALRAYMRDGQWEAANAMVPAPAREVFGNACAAGLSQPERLDALLLYTLRQNEPHDSLESNEGLDALVRKHAGRAVDARSLLDRCVSRRYTRARVTRLFAQYLLHMDSALANAYPSAPYARLLGFRRSARPLLTELRRRAAIPFASDAAVLRDHPVFQLEVRATDLWGLTTDAPGYRAAGRDYTQKFLIYG